MGLRRFLPLLTLVMLSAFKCSFAATPIQGHTFLSICGEVVPKSGSALLGGNISIERVFPHGNILQGGLFVQCGRLQSAKADVPFQRMGADASWKFCMAKPLRGRLLFYMGVETGLGWEQINCGKRELSTGALLGRAQALTLFFSGGAELSVFIRKRTFLTLGAKGRFFACHLTERFGALFFLGTKILINQPIN